jgi:CRISPR/Cas system CSM-associated protein Csm3 (group 7 of RAMP superfamily)
VYKRLLNELQLTLAIQPLSPLLIKSSQESAANPLLPSMNFVRSAHPFTGDSTIYIPGSSLKGVVRTRAEQMARTLRLRVDEFNEFNAHKRVAEQIGKSVDAGEPWRFYQHVCTITRLFGSTALAGRAELEDFYPERPIDTLPIRQMVAIDRRSGASANTFTMEVAPPVLNDGTPVVFFGRVVLRNFERWQLGLLAMVLHDMASSLVPLGFGSGRGLGQVRVFYRHFNLSYPGILDAASAPPTLFTRVLGVGDLASVEEVSRYGFHHFAAADEYQLQPENFAWDWGRARLELGANIEGEDWTTTHTTIESLLKPLVKDWADYAQKNQAR